MIEREPLDQVLSHYAYKVRNIRLESYKQKKAVWWVNSDAGMLILKKHPNSEALVKFLLAAIDHLTKNGIHIPHICRTTAGDPYVVINETCYILMEAVSGRNPDYHSDSLELYVRELGRFHRASQGFVPPDDCQTRQHLGQWPQRRRKQKDQIEELFSQEKDNPTHNAFGEIFLREYPYFRQRITASLAGLEGPAYLEWVEKVRRSGGLCHQDFAAGNILIDADNTVYVLDTDSLTIDIPARDIRKMLNKMMKKDGTWDIGRLEKVIYWYQQENPLTANEWQVVKLDLAYPHLFIGAILKYYKKKEQNWSECKYVSKLSEMIRVEKSFDLISDEYERIVSQVLAKEGKM